MKNLDKGDGMSTVNNTENSTERKETIKTAIKQFINATVDLSVELYFDQNDKKEIENGNAKSNKRARNNSTKEKSRK